MFLFLSCTQQWTSPVYCKSQYTAESLPLETVKKSTVHGESLKLPGKLALKAHAHLINLGQVTNVMFEYEVHPLFASSSVTFRSTFGGRPYHAANLQLGISL